jgi:hypothetical protein
MRTPRIAGALTALLTAHTLVAPAWAQDALIVDRQFVSASRAFGEPLGPAPDELRGPLAGGGRFAVMGATIVDRVVGTITTIPSSVTLAAVDPLRGRVFVRDFVPGTARISELDIATGALRPLFTVPAGAAVDARSVQYAAAANRLYVNTTLLDVRVPTPITQTIEVFDGSSGAPLSGGFSFLATVFAPWLITPEGDAAYAGVGGGLEIIDLATGARRLLAQPVTRLQWDEGFERLFVHVGETVFVLTRDGTVVGSAAMGGCYAIAQSAHTGRLYVRREYYQPPTLVSDLRVFDGATLTLLGQVSMPFPSAVRCEALVYSAPGAPRRVDTRVTGHAVTLSWVNVGAASHTILDVGLASGRTDLSVALGPGPSAFFSGVPSGTYYLRLRGGNGFGGGRPSQEIRLVVP